MDIAVYGAGSLGSLLGGLLAREHSVTLVGRAPHVDVVAESGLAVTGHAEATTTPMATTDGTGLDATLAIVTVKSFDTPTAARDLATGRYDAVLSLQNGLGNEEVLADHLDAPVLAGTASYGARLVDPGHVECTGIGEIVLGAREGGPSAVADRIGRAFSAAGLETTVVEDAPRRLWEKLAVNAGINATTALARIDNGALLTGPARCPARQAAREVARVATAEGIDLATGSTSTAAAEATAVEALDRVADATAENVSSMRQDVEAGRRTEVDAIYGAVVDRAAAHEIDVPVSVTLASLLRAWERENGLR